MKKQDMNLLESYNRVAKNKANQGSTGRIYILIVLGAILISLSYYAKLQFDNYVIETKIKDIQLFLTSPQNAARNLEADKLSKDIRSLDLIQTKLDDALKVINYLPSYNSDIMNLIFAERPGTIRIESVSFDNGKVVLEVLGTRYYSVSDYVMRLRRLHLFDGVEYNGYFFEDSRYFSTITVILKGGN